MRKYYRSFRVLDISGGKDEHKTTGWKLTKEQATKAIAGLSEFVADSEEDYVTLTLHKDSFNESGYHTTIYI